MQSFTTTESESTTFTRAHAKHIMARVATDLARLTNFYDTGLTETHIKQFQEEAIEYLKAGYLTSVTYGFRKEVTDWLGFTHIEWVLALKYVVNNGVLEGGSSAPGGIKPGADISGAHFHSYLVQSSKFFNLDVASRTSFKESLPITRTSGEEPNGNWRRDRAYGSGGRYVDRYTCGN